MHVHFRALNHGVSFKKQLVKCNLCSAILNTVLLCDVECKLCDAIFPVLSMACSPCCAVFRMESAMHHKQIRFFLHISCEHVRNRAHRLRSITEYMLCGNVTHRTEGLSDDSSNALLCSNAVQNDGMCAPCQSLQGSAVPLLAKCSVASQVCSCLQQLRSEPF